MIEICGIYIYQGKAYLPVLGKSEVWYFHPTEEVIICDLALEPLVASLRRIVERGNPPIRHPTQAEFRKPDSVQRALGFRSYRQMAKAGVMACTVGWPADEGEIALALSPQGVDDIRKIDYTNEEHFPWDTDLETIARRILDEWESRQSE